MINKSEYKSVLTYAAGCGAMFEKIMAECGYKPLTTYFSDFSIAEWFGEDSIKDTYKRAVAEHKNNVEWITEICMVLNHKSWQHSKDGVVDEIGKIYLDLYYELRDAITGYEDDNDEYHQGFLDEEGLEYFYRITD